MALFNLKFIVALLFTLLSLSMAAEDSTAVRETASEPCIECEDVDVKALLKSLCECQTRGCHTKCAKAEIAQLINTIEANESKSVQ